MSLSLKTPIEAQVETDGKIVWQRGMVIGRTIEQTPRYDVALLDGRVIGNLPGDRVRLWIDRVNPEAINLQPITIPHLGKVT